jgi:hypothetical protein
MELKFRQTISAPPSVVYQVLHDRFTDVPLHIPSLLSITEIRRAPVVDGAQKTEHRWKANPDLLPAIARPFVKPSIHEWTGFAEWRHTDREVHFVFESDYVRGLYDCRGAFYVLDEGGKSGISVDVTFVVHADRLPALPRLLRNRIADVVETTLINTVRPSLAVLPDAVANLLPKGA